VKQIIAVVRPFVAEQVVEALRRGPVEALVVREVRGYGRQKDFLASYAESEYALAFLPKVEIEAWVEDARVEEVIQRITELAHTGRPGDGKVLVLPVRQFQTLDGVLAAPTGQPPRKPAR
jgi:nitrogen regulatory protein P-II 1